MELTVFPACDVRATDDFSVEVELSAQLHKHLGAGSAAVIRDLETIDNLAIRAARALLQEANIVDKYAVRIRLVKAVPPGAGLGSGSGNAAAVLKGLNQLLKLEYTEEKLYKIGAIIGSDVPALIAGGPVLVGGWGEQVRPFDVKACDAWFDYLRTLALVVIVPPFGVNTSEAYAELRGVRPELPSISGGAYEETVREIVNRELLSLQVSHGEHGLVVGANSLLWDISHVLCNDFHDALMASRHQLAEMFRRVEMVVRGVLPHGISNGVGSGEPKVLLSGSGSAMFVVLSDRAKAEIVLAKLEEILPECLIYSASVLTP